MHLDKYGKNALQICGFFPPRSGFRDWFTGKIVSAPNFEGALLLVNSENPSTYFKTFLHSTCELTGKKQFL